MGLGEGQPPYLAALYLRGRGLWLHYPERPPSAGVLGLAIRTGLLASGVPDSRTPGPKVRSP